MIRRTKKRLYKLIFYPLLLTLFYVVIPYVLSSNFNLKLIDIILIFGIPNFAIIYFLIHRHSRKLSALILDMQKMQENINIVDNHRRKQKEFIAGFGARIERYNSLKSLIEKLNQQFELEVISKSLLESIFKLIGQNKGNCILYLVDPSTQQLEIYATKKEHPHLVIKAKRGDVFDSWVLKHTSTLLVEDIKKDFRFDLEKIEDEYTRPIGSLISAPLVSQERVLGIIRLDNPFAFAYTQNDLRFLNTIADLTSVAIENIKLFKETQELAIRDSLTSCYTRKYLLDSLKHEFRRSMKEKSNLSLLMIDIDHFKIYNDKYGHIAGDIVLKEISLLIEDIVADHKALVSRYGGEEFCVLLRGVGKDKAREIAEIVRRSIEDKEIILRQQNTSVTVSIGLANYPKDVNYEEELIHRSDSAMYNAKQKGRNRVCSF